MALSSTEAEYISASLAVRDIIWAKALLGELSIKIEIPRLSMDNQSAIKIIESDNYQARSKHIDVKYHHIKDSYKNTKFTLAYVKTDLQKADILTKALTPKQHTNKMNLLGLY